ncbi:MAG: hypothetical protein JWR10_2670 [Rubritepida sp.]|nr:hypothetical protein [Rubritepida sp.]
MAEQKSGDGFVENLNMVQSDVKSKLDQPKRATVVRPYPMYSLEKALAIALAIKEKNAGNPWPPSQIAKAIGIGEKSSSLDFWTRSSQLYGLTSGTRQTAAISLEKIGRELVYAPNPESEINARRRAFINVEIFAKVLEYYKGCNLPELTFLSNTLESEFGLPKLLHEEFRKIFLENCQFAQISSDWRGLDSTPMLPARRENPGPVPAIKSFAASENKDGKRCFVIMPFTEARSNRAAGFFEEVFDSLIKPAAEAAGFDVLTANKDGSDVIQSTIINEIMDSELVIADLTDHNPNVLFELGLRMAQEKPVAIIKTSDTGRIFDVDNMLRVFEYKEHLWPSTIKTDVAGLEGHIRATWEQKSANRSYISILRARN